MMNKVLKGEPPDLPKGCKYLKPQVVCTLRSFEGRGIRDVAHRGTGPPAGRPLFKSNLQAIAKELWGLIRLTNMGMLGTTTMSSSSPTDWSGSNLKIFCCWKVTVSLSSLKFRFTFSHVWLKRQCSRQNLISLNCTLSFVQVHLVVHKNTKLIILDRAYFRKIQVTR